MTIPRFKTGNEATDRSFERTQQGVNGLEARAFPIILATDLDVPVFPDEITIDLPQPISAWFVVNRRSGGAVFEVSRTGRRLTISTSSAPCEVDIGGW